MEQFHKENLSVNVDQRPDKQVMIWSGENTSRDIPKELYFYFDRIIDELTGRPLEVDFTTLTYINSSTIIPIIYLINLLNNRKIPSVLKYNRELTWQRASFKGLETLTKHMQYVDIVEVPS